jgi:hypothetical protein
MKVSKYLILGIMLAYTFSDDDFYFDDDDNNDNTVVTPPVVTDTKVYETKPGTIIFNPETKSNDASVQTTVITNQVENLPTSSAAVNTTTVIPIERRPDFPVIFYLI